MKKENISRLVAFIIIFGLFGIDRIIKIYVVNYLKPIYSVTAIKGIFNWTFVENNGAMFSSFAGKTTFLIILSSLAIIFCVCFLWMHIKSSKLLTISLILVIGGGLGNLFDRIFRGGLVIDYIEPTFFDFAIFNFADCCVVIGEILLLLYLILDIINDRKSKSKS